MAQILQIIQAVLDKFKLLIAGLIFEFYHIKWKKDYPQQLFNTIFDKVSSAMIIMPLDEKGIAAGISLAKHLLEKNMHVTILVHTKFRSLLPLSVHVKVEEFFDSEVNPFGIPKPLFLEKLHMMEFDLVIDLDGTSEYTTSAMALALKAKNKVGARKKCSDKVYNLEFALSGNSMVESYQNYVNLLCTF